MDLPQELVVEAIKCKDDKEARALGIEWCVNQCRELIAYGVPGIHFLYSGCGGECERGGGSCLLIVFNGNVSVRPFIAPVS